MAADCRLAVETTAVRTGLKLLGQVSYLEVGKEVTKVRRNEGGSGGVS